MQDCPHCGEPLGGATIVCPHCGTTLIEKKKSWRLWFRKSKAAQQNRSEKRDPETAAKPRHLWRKLLLSLLAIVVFVAVLAGSAYYGIYMGERDRQMRREAVIEQHYQAGITALNDGRFERAVSEFEYVLTIDGNNALARQGLTEARTRLEVKPTPTLEAAVSLAEQLLMEAEAAYEQQDWVSTARTLAQLRALDPDFAQERVETMLFDSLYHAGIAYLDQDLLEVGISYLDQAIALRPLDADVVARRNLAVRYLDALNYWGVDWELCIDRFEALATTAPDYKDVTQRLYRAYIEYGDYLASQGELCPAEIQYSHALRMVADPALEDKRARAAETCLIATPVPVDGAAPALTPQPITGFTSGRLAYPVYNSATGAFDLYALYADGRIIAVARSADQPWWEWNTGRVAYRDHGAGAVQMELPEEGVPLQILPPAQQAWPTLSPDSQRIAYAIQEPDGTWAIYIANTNGVGEPERLASGWAPAWGRSGLLAYTGCDAEGNCGIIVTNPDDGQPGGRLTGSADDSAVSWAPGGNMMAYMTKVTGNWDLFLLNPQGGVEQLTTESSNEGLPAWSPDGSRLAFVSDRSGSWAIYIIDLNSRETWQILDLGAAFPGIENQRLSWAP
jgi:tetratricopeptide (TPR) repeat protein